MLFSRASLSGFWSWLNLPAGSSPSHPEGGLTPKHSRLFAIAILAASVLLLFLLPLGRTAVSTVLATWRGYEMTPGDQREIVHIALQAEKDKDARSLAFAALANPASEQGMHWADEAVAMDPSLTWIYSGRFYRPVDWAEPAPWDDRLRAYDPDNAFVYLLSSEEVSQPLAISLATADKLQSVLAQNAKWRSTMESAIHAPRYDAYADKEWQLISYVWERHPALSPSIIGYAVWSGRIPNLVTLRMFTDIEIGRAQQAASAGHLGEARKILGTLDSFGERLSGGGKGFEYFLGLTISQKAVLESVTLSKSTGQPDFATFARLQSIESRFQDIRDANRAGTTGFVFQPAHSLRTYALLFQISSLLFLLGGLSAIGAYLYFEFFSHGVGLGQGLGRRSLRSLADYSPTLTLVACCALLLSFLPISNALAAYRTQPGSAATFRSISSTFWELLRLPTFLDTHFDHTPFWWFVTIGLSILGLIVIARGVRRSEPVKMTAV